MTRELIRTMVTNSARPDLIRAVEIEGASHYYSGCEIQLTEAILGWVRDL